MHKKGKHCYYKVKRKENERVKKTKKGVFEKRIEKGGEFTGKGCVLGREWIGS